MKLKLSYTRLGQRGEPRADITVTTEASATVADVAVAILAADPSVTAPASSASPTLRVTPPGSTVSVMLDPDQLIGEAPVASGFGIQVLDSDSAPLVTGSEQTAAVLRVESGPDAGLEVGLAPGTVTIGRDVACEVVLSDRMVSKRHARIVIGQAIEVIDQNSANGLLVDGGLVPRLTLLAGQTVTLGDSVISIVRTERAVQTQMSETIVAGAIGFNRSPRVEQRYPARVHPRPDAPSELAKQRFPWLLMVTPILMGLGMYALTGRAVTLLFIAMTPLMLVSNYLMGRGDKKREMEQAMARFDEQLAHLEETLSAEQPIERALRRAEAPSVADCLESGMGHRDDLFTRRVEHWNFLHLRLGLGRVASRNTLAEARENDAALPECRSRLEDLEERFRLIDGVPVVEDPILSGALGVCGPLPAAASATRGLLVQLTAQHSPAELAVLAMAGPELVGDFEWLKWLPHTASVHSPVPPPALADSAATTLSMLSHLEALIAMRTNRTEPGSDDLRPAASAALAATDEGASIGESPMGAFVGLPVVAVLIAGQVPADRGRLVQLTERAAEAGVVVIWVAETRTALPAACRTVLDVSGGFEDAEVGFVRHGQSVVKVSTEGVTVADATGYALRMSALVDTGAVVADASDLPRTVTLLSLIGTDMAVSASSVMDRWMQNDSVHDRSGRPPVPRRRPPTLRALVGQGAVDAMHLDLRTQGPHALVGGTTGAGKSEFLQAWVLAMAAEYSPDRLTFLFVDYKGGAAFADCVKLPHCVGLVTDLSPHLVRRALTSLRAELRHREHLLNRKKAKDLISLEMRGDPDAPPALIIVIDEFAALVSDVPEFVDGVVDIAQRGRSLGIHLIMATQRPAGVIKDNLRANTNLRVALRMADEHDSNDVVGTVEAAWFDPSIPGRGVAKTGPGRLTPFQSAYAGGWTSDEPELHEVLVHELRFGADVQWSPAERPVEDPPDPGPTDQTRLVATIALAAGQGRIPAPRRPWLNELSRIYDLVRLGPRNDRQLILGVVDRPEEQAQTTAFFEPDTDGNLAVYGTGGSGKTVLLRTLAAAAGVTPRGGPVDVYGLDFAAGGLRMLEVLPHVGSVIAGDDAERVVRLFKMLKGILEDRARRYPAANAGSIAEYRINADAPEEPRILLLLDGIGAFRSDWETGATRAPSYAAFMQLLSEGRQLGIHVVFTADRPGSVPSAVASSVPRRVVLRMADETNYLMLDAPDDILDSASPPGRAIIDGSEAQVAILGGSGNVADQSAAMTSLAAAITGSGRRPVATIASLPSSYASATLPDDLDGKPVLGIGDDDLAPIGFEPSGAFLLGGGPGSGRTNALKALVFSIQRAVPQTRFFYLGNRRSELSGWDMWTTSATTPEEAAELAKQLSADIPALDDVHLTIVIEALAEFQSTSADAPLVELIKQAKRAGHLIVAESETSTWTSSWPIYAEIKSARRGLLLQPDSIEGDTIMRTTFPRVSRTEFPPGRGFYVASGKVVRVQVPMAP